MKRIVFLYTKWADEAITEDYRKYCEDEGFLFAFVPAGGNFVPNDEDLVCVDSVSEYERLLTDGVKTVVSVDNPDAAKAFEGAEYVVTKPFDVDVDYFEKVWRRLHNIPWEISRTERLILRETVESDADVFYEMYKDPSITRYNEKLYEDVEAERAYITEYRRRVYEVSGYGIWTVVRSIDNAIIGRAGLTAREGFDDVEIGFVIGKQYQGCGYAKEAVTECLRIAKALSFARVNALIMDGNDVSVRLVSGLGFKDTGIVNVSGNNYHLYVKVL